MPQEKYAVITLLTASDELLRYTAQRHARVSARPVVAGEFLRAEPLSSSSSGASPENVLLLRKRQSHITPVGLWFVAKALLLQPCCCSYCSEIGSTERLSALFC